MPNSDDDEGTVEADPAYLALYHTHLDDFRAHLAGRDGSEPLPASYFPPNACWSAAEKDAFFRGLAIHSRLRPDLIAEEVKTKTVPDVCVYLALLEEATHEASRTTVYVGAETRPVDPRLPRQELPAAVEVSDMWLQLEERMSGALVDPDTLQREAVAKEREKEVHTRQASIRARKGQARTASNDRDREGERQRRKDFNAWFAEAKAQWEAEDAWGALDHSSLSALDRMLREDEEGYAVGELPEDAEDLVYQHEGLETLEAKLPSSPTGLRGTPLAPGEELIDPILLQLSRPDTAMSYASSSEPASYSLVDPGSLPPSTHLQPSTPPFPPASHITDPAPLPVPLPPSILDTSAAFLADDGSIGDAAEEDIASMSPVSRRRFKKRLYMRRKRAQASGRTADENTTRLKPGRKPKERLPRKTDASTVASSPMVVDNQPLPDEPEQPFVEPDASQYRHPHMSGRTLPYKRQIQFAYIGIDAQRLYQEGLGLFHFRTISKLMQMYNQLHDIPAEVASQITVETFQLLYAIVAQFVAEVMSRAITSREQERIAKLQTKAWRLRENQNVSAIHVKHALTLFGADSLDKRSHFAGLLNKLGLDEERDKQEVLEVSDDESPEHDEVEEEEATSGDIEASRTPLEPLSALRMIFPPFFNPNPPASGSGTRIDEHPDPLDPSVYMPWPSSSLLATSSEPPREEDLLPDNIDEVALAAELLADGEIEKEDTLRDTEEENALWKRFGGRPARGALPTGGGAGDIEPKLEPSAEGGEAPRRTRKRRAPSKSVRIVEDGADANSDADGQASDTAQRRVRPRKGKRQGKGTAHLNEDQLRFMEPDPNGHIKSSVYILDSD
ncbi:uncharacterized protein TRAVEDRAFT_71439 [Trametes versicolor FP-101664 SS1]|uniref:uncharacterized protein n=1 Tax=Trametes versicolor (strain FP-101664) TaxID=717944 RepID=UPI0004623357|nr:uncharacterized protein TRAVEDRAFT_71439 [Trametes versicolor FP-101664 SS1]EIW59330.1 hypothetical protein TRAVEDRAFT_71439 [Trametes versicolor FP-101664 SS1]